MGRIVVVGASGASVPVTVDGAAAFSLAEASADTINGLASSGSLFAQNLLPGAAIATVPGGATGEALLFSPGSVGFPSGYDFLIIPAAGATVDETETASATTVLAGTGDTTVMGGGGGGAFIAGGGGNLFQGASVGGGSYTIALGNGNDSVDAFSGNNLVYTGTAHNQVELHGGQNTVWSSGSDNIIADSDGVIGLDGSGSNVSAGERTLVVDNGIGNSVRTGSLTSETIFGGGGGHYTYGPGQTTIIGGADDTISGGGTSTDPAHANIFGGINTVVDLDSFLADFTFIADPGERATLVGVTSDAVFGASGANVSYASAEGLSYLIAGAGNETLNGARASGSLELFGGEDTALTGGSGSDTVIAGTGNNTITGGAGGANLFIFSKGAAGGHDVITDFTGAAGNLVGLFGYGANAAQAALAGASSSGSGSVISLTDNTTITFDAVTPDQLKADAARFFST